MKLIPMIAAAGSLVALSAPAHAAEFAPSSERAASTFTIGSSLAETNPGFDTFGQTLNLANDPPRHAPAYGRRHKKRYHERGYYDDRYDGRRYKNRYREHVYYDDRHDAQRYKKRHRDDEYYEDRYDDDRIYDRNGRYYKPRRVSRGDRIWQGRDGRYYCKRDNGTTGLIIGAAGGALIGRSIDTRGDRAVGTLLGGALGAVIGREIDRGDARCH